MRRLNYLVVLGCFTAALLATTAVALAAYQHGGSSTTDAQNILKVYPDLAGTKLDNCVLCHGGGTATIGGKKTTMGSCLWCHYITNYGEVKTNYPQTLNGYGKDYETAGRTDLAIKAIATLDSDGDSFANEVEINAIRYPGDPNDDPTKVPAPFRVFSRAQLEALPQYTEFMLLNATKSTDFYAEYTGVTMEELMKSVATLPSATGVQVSAPDGFSWTHPLYPTQGLYHLIGPYPDGTFYYNETADIAKNPNGWCDYSAPSVKAKTNGDSTPGLKALLAIKRDGSYLTPGVLTPSNKLDGEGPYRVVPPQLVPGWPDQRSTATSDTRPWPYSDANDHNAGAATRSTTMIKVNPLPPGTTDINILEAGWNYVDNAQIVVYGAINPVPTIKDKLDALAATINAADPALFKQPNAQKVLTQKIGVVKKIVGERSYAEALQKLQDDLLQKTDGCSRNGFDDGNDWVKDCTLQGKLYWSINEIATLIKIML